MSRKMLCAVFIILSFSCLPLYCDSVDNFASGLKSISSYVNEKTMEKPKTQKQKLEEREQLKLNESLIDAIIFKKVNDVEIFIKKGADQNYKDKGRENKTPLMFAALLHHLNIAKYLVENGADLNTQDNNGFTALMHAAHTGYNIWSDEAFEILKYLIEKGAQVNIQNNNGVTALMITAALGKIDELKYLVKHGANLDLKSSDGNTVVANAIINSHFNVLKYLAEKGANLNIQSNFGTTTLMHAVKINTNFTNTNTFKMVEYLIHKGLNINIKDANNNTALFYAVESFFTYKRNYLNIIKTLLFHNAIFDANDKIYKEASKDQQLKDLFDEIIDYKNDVKSMFPKKALEKAITHNGANNSAFTKYEWLTLAILNNNVTQIQYCVDQKIFTPFEILEGLVLRPHMPLTAFEWLWNRADNKEQEKLEKLAQEHKNQKFLDAIVKFKFMKSAIVKPSLDINIIQ